MSKIRRAAISARLREGGRAEGQGAGRIVPFPNWEGALWRWSCSGVLSPDTTDLLPPDITVI